MVLHHPPRAAALGVGDPSGQEIRRLGWGLRTVGILSLGTLLVLQLVAPTALGESAGVLAVIGILIGVPHGAVDHLVPFWSTGQRVTLRPLGSVLLRYLAVLAVALGAVHFLPLPTVWVFLAVSAVHFGRGEVVVAAELAGRRVPRAADDLIPALAHGAIVLGIPLAVWTSVSSPVLDRLAPGFVDTPSAAFQGILFGTVILGVVAAVTLVIKGRLLEAAELLLLAAVFTLVPPLAAFGVYFGLWHSMRHTLRLVYLPGSDGRVDVRTGMARYLKAAVLPTLGAAALLLVLIRYGDASLLTAELALVVGLTAPHLGIVATLDHRVARR